jgi:RNA polymerase sigma-70 factor (ECF subfamily)
LLLSEHPQGDKPKTHALTALLSFHAARLPGRLDDDGSLLQLEIQDRAKWDQDLVLRGFHHLDKSSTGIELSAHHLEAAIAALHCSAESFEKTDWAEILKLYDSLYKLKPSPIVALNRAIAVGKAQGPDDGLVELSRIPDSARLQDYPFYSGGTGGISSACRPQGGCENPFRESLAACSEQGRSKFFRAEATGLPAKCRSQIKLKGFLQAGGYMASFCLIQNRAIGAVISWMQRI